MVTGLIPLETLRVGQSAQIGRIHGHLDHVHRLKELGFHRGAKVEMYRPGNPCIIRLAGGKLCLRSDDLLRVFVEPGHDSVRS